MRCFGEGEGGWDEMVGGRGRSTDEVVWGRGRRMG